MATNTFRGLLRSTFGGSEGATTPAVVTGNLLCTVDPTVAGAGIGKYLPLGARVVGIRSFAGATGGASPTIDVGTAGTPDGYGPELDADTVDLAGTVGALGGIATTAITEIWAGVGASAATGGTTSFSIEYVVDDDGTVNS